ncbi:MAG: hypothetical protein EZS28_032878 [Streblomastix strix]|uniref:Protein kinase domain-containing protein n=1 Tax=Streblomastix strix TaxID=222440 RepID=A0A5J4ULS4_9EUKA|nr:MAG: hypothetical protein EZS28_032878 [Streblomastix strix]
MSQTLQAQLYYSRGQLGFEQVQSIFKSLLQVLSANHQQGISHNSLHPENIVVQPNGTVTLSYNEHNCAQYYSPEVLLNPELINNKEGVFMPGNDMWAFGNILFESALGYPSIEGETYNDILSGIFGRYGNPTRSDLRYIDDKTYNKMRFSNPISPPASWCILGRGRITSEGTQTMNKELLILPKEKRFEFCDVLRDQIIFPKITNGRLLIAKFR